MSGQKIDRRITGFTRKFSQNIAG